MDDPLSRALAKAPDTQVGETATVVDRHIAAPRGVRDVLADIREQALAAFALPFFDGDTGVSSTPVVKVGLTESGSMRISARRIAPSFEAVVALDLRTDVEAIGEGHYQICGRCEISCEGTEPQQHREFPVPIEIGDDGNVTIDVNGLRREMAHAIRAFQS